MILDFLPTGDWENFVGVPAARIDSINMQLTRSSVLVARIVEKVPDWLKQLPSDIAACLERNGKWVKALVIMTNDGPESWKHLESHSLPIYIAQQMRLPGGINYSGNITIADRTWLWWSTQMIVRDGNHFLTPQFVQFQAPFKLPVPDDVSLSDLQHNPNVRSRIFGSLWMPRRIRITGRDIIINQK